MARIKACYRERDRKFRTKSINLQEVDENIVGNGPLHGDRINNHKFFNHPFTYSSHKHNRAI
jgi:hypothetical protein